MERNTYKEKFEQLQIISEEHRKHKVNEHSIQVSASSVDEFEKGEQTMLVLAMIFPFKNFVVCFRFSLILNVLRVVFYRIESFFTL